VNVGAPHARPAPFGFGRERRVRRRSEFLRIQSRGERVSTPHFVMLVAARPPAKDCPAPREARPRLGVVVTKKVGNAVVRARVKRLCRECFRLWPDLLPPGIDLVVIARQGAGELVLADVRAEWRRARPRLLERCASVLRAGPSAAAPAAAGAEKAGASAPAASSSAAKNPR
jgi:ribonuclease P protein component